MEKMLVNRLILVAIIITFAPIIFVLMTQYNTCDNHKRILPPGYNEDSDGLWKCIEYKNETMLNKEFIDKCCADISSGTMNGLEFGGSVCISGDMIDQVTIEDQEINLTECKNISREIQTNKTYCVLKERVW